MIGESFEHINFLYERGTSDEDAGGKQPISCSKGLKGAPISNVIFCDIFCKFTKSLIIGADLQMIAY
jgi:hypothetical protein